jgi:hypothetical protein
VQVDFQELRLGLKRLETDPPTDFTRDDFDSQIIRRGFAQKDQEVRQDPSVTGSPCPHARTELLGPFTQMDFAAFKTFIDFELKEYVQKQMAKAAGLVHVHAVCVGLRA